MTTLLGGGEILLGLALRGETLLDLDCFPGRGLESTDLELAPGLPLVQSLLRGERPLLGLTARHRYGRLRGENDTREACIARLNKLLRSLETWESGSPENLIQKPSHSSSLLLAGAVT